MTLFAIALVTVSAFTHAGWNFLSKRQNPQAALFLMASIGSSLILSPLLLIYRDGLRLVPAPVWGLIAATGSVQALYYLSLAAAYRAGDLSHAYPLARSLPVVFVTLISLGLGRGGQIGPLAMAGFVVLAVGCLILPLPGFGDIQLEYYRRKWVPFALAAALCTAGYTLLDDQSLRLLRDLPAAPLDDLGWALLFGELESISISLFLALLLAVQAPERKALRAATGRDWLQAAGMGCIILGNYGLVLLAMAYVRNVSYVSAFRQLSIPIGAALGLLVNKEPAHGPKLAGIGLALVGQVLVAVG